MVFSLGGGNSQSVVGQGDVSRGDRQLERCPGRRRPEFIECGLGSAFRAAGGPQTLQEISAAWATGPHFAGPHRPRLQGQMCTVIPIDTPQPITGRHRRTTSCRLPLPPASRKCKAMGRTRQMIAVVIVRARTGRDHVTDRCQMMTQTETATTALMA